MGKKYYEIVKAEGELDAYFPGIVSVDAVNNGTGEILEIHDSYEDAEKSFNNYYTKLDGRNVTEYYLQRVECTAEGSRDECYQYGSYTKDYVPSYWCEGTLKIRGKKCNITKFILEELRPAKIYEEKCPKLSLDKYGDAYSRGLFKIKDTKGGFIQDVNVDSSNYEDDEIFIKLFDAKFLHEIYAEELQKICIKYKIDMKIYGFESVTGFNQDVEIVEGTIIKDKKIKFDDYLWECSCPRMGGDI